MPVPWYEPVDLSNWQHRMKMSQEELLQHCQEQMVASISEEDGTVSVNDGEEQEGEAGGEQEEEAKVDNSRQNLSEKNLEINDIQ